MENQQLEIPTNSDLQQNNSTPEDYIKLLSGNLSTLTHQQKLDYYGTVCQSLKLNPLTKPLEFISMPIKGGGAKTILYLTKDGAAQLSSIHSVSLNIISEVEDKVNKLYKVIVRASTPTGRSTEELGVVSLKDFYGKLDLENVDLANAMMKAVTKAKRRAILSICGLGFLDETEIETIRGIEKERGSFISNPVSESIKPMTDKQKNLSHVLIRQCEDQKLLTAVEIKATKDAFNKPMNMKQASDLLQRLQDKMRDIRAEREEQEKCESGMPDPSTDDHQY